MHIGIGIFVLLLSFLSSGGLGAAVPTGSWSPKKEYAMEALTLGYLDELIIQNSAIDTIEYQFERADGFCSQEIVNQLDALIESCRRRIEPRNRLIEIAPTDSVVTTDSVEYWVAVSSHYAQNVMRAAGKLRETPEKNYYTASIVRYIKSQHQKSQLCKSTIFSRISLIRGSLIEILAVVDELLFDWVESGADERDSMPSMLDNHDGDEEVAKDCLKQIDEAKRRKNQAQEADLRSYDSKKKDFESFMDAFIKEHMAASENVAYTEGLLS
ncbi:hypothetical protein O181_001880 [Austropuccinia psidii MF-1]|uniref:Secreted protein n=1 Tax=Austropuccinia psidii MF-1 TaxID=1389203 RepID=A0A9Q3BBZ1_9BASI|nr:hypothetical protein [Austropuccinia psidii MF-1]